MGSGRFFFRPTVIADAARGDAPHPAPKGVAWIFAFEGGDARSDTSKDFLAGIGCIAGLQAGAPTPAINHGVKERNHAIPSFLIIGANAPQQARSNRAW